MTENTKKEDPKPQQFNYKSEVDKAIQAAKPLFNKIGYQLGGKTGEVAADLFTAALSSALTENPAAIISAISSLIAGQEDPTMQMLQNIDKRLVAIKEEIDDLSKWIYDSSVSTAIDGINNGLTTFCNDISGMGPNADDHEKQSVYQTFNSGSMVSIRTNLESLVYVATGNTLVGETYSIICKNIFNNGVYEKELNRAALNVAIFFREVNIAFLNASKLGILLQTFNPKDTFGSEVDTNFENYKNGLANNFGCLVDVGANLLTDKNFVPGFQLSTNEDSGKVLFVDATDNNYLRFIDSVTYNKNYASNPQSYFYYNNSNLIGATSSEPNSFANVQYSWVLPNNYYDDNPHHHDGLSNPICNVNESYTLFSSNFNSIIVENIGNTNAFAKNIPAIIVSVRDTINDKILCYNSTLNYATVENTTYVNNAAYDNQGGPQGDEVFCLTFDQKQSKN